MNNSQEKLQAAMKYAMENRPKKAGFPFLAECLKKTGVEKNIWSLPSAQSIYVMKESVIVQQGTPLVAGISTVSDFNEELLISTIRTDQRGESTFPEFLNATWNAGVVGYEVDFSARTVCYCGARGEKYIESYEKVEVPDFS